MRDYKGIKAYKLADDLVLKIYDVTRNFPKEEIYGLTSQIRRAVISISNNIAEGSGVGSNADYIRYLRIANGSLNEVESLSIIANKLSYIKNDDFIEIKKSIEKERKLLYGLIIF